MFFRVPLVRLLPFRLVLPPDVSIVQEGMLGETVRNPAAYWSHRLFPLRPTIDVGALHAAWENVAHRTEMLRAVFVPAAAYTSNYSQSQTMPYDLHF